MQNFRSSSRWKLVVCAGVLLIPSLANGEPSGDEEPAQPATQIGSTEEPPADAARADTTSRSARRIYTPKDFSAANPRTALDMLRHVPGFVIRAAAQERGLGQATGNVLLNGQRISGKSDDILAQLGRIPIQDVDRIEIVDGATLDVPGLSGQVANIATRARGINGQYSWRGETRTEHTSPLFSNFDLSVSGARGPVEFTLGLQNSAFRHGAGGPTYIESTGGELIERRDEVWTMDGEQPHLSGRFAIDGPGTSLGNLNASWQAALIDYEEDGQRDGPDTIALDRPVTATERRQGYEIGGDFEFALGPGRLKLIGLNRYQHVSEDEELLMHFADGAPDEGSRFTRVSDEGEGITRAEYRLSTGGSEYQLSAEGAYNVLDGESKLFALNGEGMYEEIPLPGGSARVSEDRYQVMASHGRKLRETLSIQLALGGEHSRLHQEGAGGLTRSFWRPKGTVSVAWKATRALDLTLRLQRRVGQLDFLDFLASVNLQDSQQDAANPNLVPPQSWEAELEGVRSFGGWGTTAVRIYGHVVDDIIDTIPIGDDGESPGNAGRALLYGGELKGTLNLDPIGWRGAKFDGLFILQDSRLDDPLTGEPRGISGSVQRDVILSFRHDVHDTQWAWASEYNYILETPNYRLTEVGRMYQGPHWVSVFVEHKDVFGLTVQAVANNLLYAKSRWDRTVYDGRRTGNVAYVERRERTIGPIFILKASGKF